MSQTLPQVETTIKEKYWYFTRITECVLCGAGKETKWREYGEKPKDQYKTFEHVQFACDTHFI